MIRNEYGDIAHRNWAECPTHFPGIAVAAYIIMPNHTHANIVILNHHPHPCRGEVSSPEVSPPQHPTLGQVIAYYKYQTTKAINLLRDMPGVRFWQRNYWEHVIRNETEIRRIAQYIETNPARWRDDQLHPGAPPNPFNKG